MGFVNFYKFRASLVSLYIKSCKFGKFGASLGSNLTRYCLRKFAPGFGCIKFLRIPGSVSKCRPHPLRVKKRPPSCVNLGVFKRTRKPGGFRGSSRTRKTSGTPMSLRVEEFYLNLERHETPGSFIIHSWIC